MAQSDTDTRAAGDVPPCPPEVCANPQVQAYVADLCRQHDWPPGKPVLILQPDGKYCYCTCGGAPRTSGDEVSIPACPAEQCRELRPVIDTLCRDLGYPPGQKILVANPDGSYCYCTCGGG